MIVVFGMDFTFPTLRLNKSLAPTLDIRPENNQVPRSYSRALLLRYIYETHNYHFIFVSLHGLTVSRQQGESHANYITFIHVKHLLMRFS
jgi:hypothetical protein